MTKEYMREVLEHMSIAQLIDTILINPTVHLSPSYRDTGLSATYTFKPLSNLVYTRDQQVGLCELVLLLCKFQLCPSSGDGRCQESAGLTTFHLISLATSCAFLRVCTIVLW